MEENISVSQLFCRHDFENGECLVCGWQERDCYDEDDDISQYKRERDLGVDGMTGF